MKERWLVITITAFLISIWNFASAPARAEVNDHVHILMAEARPISKVQMEANSVWDLSDAVRLKIPLAVLTSYADTLLSETVRGYRRWYELHDGSSLLVREENGLSCHIPGNPVATAAVADWGNTVYGTSCVEPYGTLGIHSGSFPVFRTGELKSYPPVKGRLAVADGDTLQAWMTMERVLYREKMFADTIRNLTAAEIDSLPVRSITRYRWFTHGSVPVAIQTEIRKSFPGQDEAESSGEIHAYIMDYSEFSETICNEEKERMHDADTTRAIDSIRATYYDGQVTVEINAPSDIEIQFDLMSDSGINYSHSTFTARGESRIEIPCGHLPAGRYVASFSVPGHVRKIFIVAG